jgi:hypothetical protein
VSKLPSLRSWVVGLALTTVAVFLCIEYVDRPIANFAHSRFHGTTLFVCAESALGTLLVVAFVAAFGLFVAGGYALSARIIRPWACTPILCCWSVAWALLAALVAKHIFGRSWPNPGYVVNSVYEFHWLHGGRGFEAFPSATIAVGAAALAVLWTARPALRVPGSLALLVVGMMLVVTNGHWIGDLVGGGFLGATVGLMTVALSTRSSQVPRGTGIP